MNIDIHTFVDRNQRWRARLESQSFRCVYVGPYDTLTELLRQIALMAEPKTASMVFKPPAPIVNQQAWVERLASAARDLARNVDERTLLLARVFMENKIEVTVSRKFSAGEPMVLLRDPDGLMLAKVYAKFDMNDSTVSVVHEVIDEFAHLFPKEG